MKYAILFEQTEDIVEYTISVLRHIAAVYGHSVVSPSEADLLAVSVCDISQISFLEKVRKQYPNKIIIVGGHAAIYYKLFGLFADMVNVGQGFEAFACQSIDELKSLSCVWTPDKDGQTIFSSWMIDWDIVPVANVTTKQRYYWGAVGCKNKCKFCVTSWTNPHQINNPFRISDVLKKHPNTTIVSNDSDAVAERMTQSVMLLDFIRRRPKKYGVYRIGVEFATEENRKHYGKPFSNDQFYQAIRHALTYGTRLKLFCIGGIDTHEDWRNLFFGIDPIYEKGSYEVKFTNICYEMFAPIKRERQNIDPARMWETPEIRAFIGELKLSRYPFKSMPCSTRANTILRNMLIYITSMEGYKKHKECKKNTDVPQLMKQLELSGFYTTDYSDTVKINHRMIGDTAKDQ